MYRVGEKLLVEKAGIGFMKIEGYSGTVFSEEEALRLEDKGTFIEGLASNDEDVFFIQIDNFIYKDDEGEKSEFNEEDREIEYEAGSIWAVREDEFTKFIPLEKSPKFKHFWIATDNQGHSMCCSFCGLDVSIYEGKHWDEHVEGNCTGTNEISIEQFKEIVQDVQDSLVEVVLTPSNRYYSGWLIYKQDNEELVFYVYEISSNKDVKGPYIYLQEPLTGKELEEQLVFISEERSHANG